MSTSNTSALSLTRAECLRASYDFNRPFELLLTEDQFFKAAEVVRILPRKRLVAFGEWQGKPAVLKLFFDKKSAKRHFEAEQAGMKALYVNNIPAPALYYSGALKEKAFYVLVYERIQNAVNLFDLWRTTPDVNQLESVLQKVVLELATQHVLGIRQKDLHLGNFLLKDSHVISIDGAQIEVFDGLIPKLESMENLALFFSQLGAGLDALCERLFLYYANARAWLIKPTDLTDLHLMIKKYDALRWIHYEKKLTRTSSSYIHHSGLSTNVVVARAYNTPAMQQFFKDPDAVFSNPDIVFLKKGRSATVVKVEMDGQWFVIKRYNLKHLWHRLRRMLRSTRAYRAFRLAHKLTHFHVATAQPIAYLEHHFLGLKARSYLVTELLPATNLGNYCQDKTADDESVIRMAMRVAGLLSALKALNITHGDLKKTNILINQQEYPVFIDLDGACEHTTLTGLDRAWKREIKRFLMNFETAPSVKSLFKERLAS